MIDDELIQGVLTAIMAAGAINWALVEWVEWNLITDGLSFAEGGQEYQIVVAVIAAAAVLRVYTQAEKITE